MIDALNSQKKLHIRGFGYDTNPFKDYSPLNGFPVVVGTPAITNDPGKFGSGYRFPGGVYLRFPNIPAIGNQDFCIEFWLKTDVTPVAYFYCPIGNWNGSNAGGTCIFVDTTNKIRFFGFPDTSNIANEVNTPSNAVVPGQWAHFAFARKAGVMKIFKDGIQVATGPMTVNLSAPTMCVGNNEKPTDTLIGAMEDVIFTYGTSKYDGNFVPVQATSYTNFVPAYFQGTGKIAGTVKVKGVPLIDVPCYLFPEGSNSPIGITYTNVTGRFEFTGLNSNELFYVVVKQNDTSWEHIVSSRRNPA